MDLLGLLIMAIDANSTRIEYLNSALILYLATCYIDFQFHTILKWISYSYLDKIGRPGPERPGAYLAPPYWGVV